MSDDSDRPRALSRIDSSDKIVLEAESHIPDSPVAAVVIAHPHPLYGGSMYDHVPSDLFRLSRDLNVAAVRFNFRGVGRSSGSHDHGLGERRDVAAVARALRAAVAPETPLGLAGWSFGADMVLGVDPKAAQEVGVSGWLAIAAPLSVVEPADMTAATSPRPKVMLVPEHDFRPPAEVASLTVDWPGTEIVIAEGCDHFLRDGRAAVASAYRRFVETITPRDPSR